MPPLLAEFIAPNVARRVSRFIQEEATKRAAAAAAAEAAADGSVVAPGSGTMTLPSAAAGSAGLDRADTDGTGNASIAAAGPGASAGAEVGPASASAAGSGSAAASSGARSVADAKASCAAALSQWAAAGSSSSAGSSSAADKAAAGSASSGSGSGFGSMLFSSIRGGVLDAVNELLDELDTSSVTLAGAAGDVLGHGDVIMTAGYDAGVRDFILAAMKAKRIGEVIIAEGGDAALLPPPSTGATVGPPVLPGHALALELTARAKPVPVTIIPDAAVATVMHRVHKVVIGARGVTIDGAVAADSPAGLLALAAAPRVPVIVVANALRVSHASCVIPSA